MATAKFSDFSSQSTFGDSDTAVGLSGGANKQFTRTAMRQSVAGKAAIWVPAGAMIARTTNGPATGSVETTTNKVMIPTLDFDFTTQQFAQFSILKPTSWDGGTVSFKAVWSHPSTTTNFGVVWQLAGLALGDAGAIDTAFGTAVLQSDTGGTTDSLYVAAESSAVTISNSPAGGKLVVYQMARAPSDAADNMAIIARLHGICLFITTTTSVDS